MVMLSSNLTARQDKNYFLVCKTHTKNLLECHPIVKTEKREIATQLTKCSECQKNKCPFLKEMKPKSL